MKRLVLGLLLVLTATVGVQTWRLRATQAELVTEQKAHAQFRGGVAALAKDAAERAARTAATNQRNKERADEENRKRATAVAAAIRSLRLERDDARRRFLSTAPAGSRCPDGQVCFDAAEFERAYGAFVGEARGIADEGTSVTTDLDTAKEWARGVR